VHRFYFPGVLVGPFLEFQAYRSLVDGSIFQTIERTDNAVALRKGTSSSDRFQLA
jgi:lysophospholipid acyltransferase